MAGLYKVAVFDSRIVGMFGPGTDASAFVRKNTGEISNLARVGAPKRSGRLALSHHTTGPYRVGPYNVAGQVYNDARHASWVHNGTYGPIYPKRPFRKDGSISTLRLPRTPSASRVGGPFIRRRWVDGQKANPWLERAARAVIARYI